MAKRRQKPSTVRAAIKPRKSTVKPPSLTIGKTKIPKPANRQPLQDFWKNYPLPSFQMAGPPPERDMLAAWCHDLCTQVSILYNAVHGQRAIVKAEWDQAAAAREKADAVLDATQDMYCKVLDVVAVRQAKSIAVHNAVVHALSKLTHLHNHNAGSSKSPDRSKPIKFTPKDIRDIMKLQIDPSLPVVPKKTEKKAVART